MNGILSLDGGRPFSISANDVANTGPGRRAAANCVGDPLPSGFTRSRERWFDTSAFAAPTAFTYGNCGYNTMRGPGRKSMNMSLFRSIRLPDDRRIELRAEAFNVFNSPMYDERDYDRNVNSTDFGRINRNTTNQSNFQRFVQLGFRLTF